MTHWILRTDPGERGTPDGFAGWDALRQRIRLPCVVSDVAAPLTPAGARFIVSTEASDAGRAGRVPVIHVGRHADDRPLGHASVTPETWFRRDVTLASIVAAIERIAPGTSVRARPHAELAPYLTGRTAHVAHGGAKVCAAVIGFDGFRVDDHDWIGDPRDLWCCQAQQFDSVLLTPDWSAVRQPRVLLDEALRIVRLGGTLVVAAPPSAVIDLLHARAECLRTENGTIRATKRRGRSWHLEAAARPTAAISVLVVSEVHDDEDGEVSRLADTILTAHRSLRGVDHEILVLLRFRPSPDLLAALRELAAAIPECRIDIDLAPLRFGPRLERLRRSARGEQLVVLASGATPGPDALRHLCAAAPRDALARPTAADGGCFVVPRALWPCGLLEHTPYMTASLWQAWTEATHTVSVDVQVPSGGTPARAARGRGPGLIAFDRELRSRGAPVGGRDGPHHALVVALRTMGDCILATAPIAALSKASVTVLTESRYAWIFEHHPNVDDVIAVPALDGDDPFWAEQELIAAAVHERDYDELIVLSDRLDNVPYFRAGRPFVQFYAEQAGVPHGAEQAYVVQLASSTHAAARVVLRDHGIVDGTPYVVVHTRAGWGERTPPVGLFEAVTTCGLPVVVVGGPGERVDVAGVINLAGRVPVAVSAAIVAGACLFVGPDSGTMHIASAFDVPTLGLYGGTGIRLVPPRARRAVSIQSTTSCARPCGRSPCVTRRCSAAGIDRALVVTLVRALLAGEDVPREWYGGAPAELVHGPDGDYVVQIRAQRSRSDASGQAERPQTLQLGSGASSIGSKDDRFAS